MIDQKDPAMPANADLHRSITATLTYIMERASVGELYGLQAYLSKLASQLAHVDAERPALTEMPPDLRQQLAEVARQQKLLREQQTQANRTPAQYRQES